MGNANSIPWHVATYRDYLDGLKRNLGAVKDLAEYLDGEGEDIETHSEIGRCLNRVGRFLEDANDEIRSLAGLIRIKIETERHAAEDRERRNGYSVGRSLTEPTDDQRSHFAEGL